MRVLLLGAMGVLCLGCLIPSTEDSGIKNDAGEPDAGSDAGAVPAGCTREDLPPVTPQLFDVSDIVVLDGGAVAVVASWFSPTSAGPLIHLQLSHDGGWDTTLLGVGIGGVPAQLFEGDFVRGALHASLAGEQYFERPNSSIDQYTLHPGLDPSLGRPLSQTSPSGPAVYLVGRGSGALETPLTYVYWPGDRQSVPSTTSVRETLGDAGMASLDLKIVSDGGAETVMVLASRYDNQRQVQRTELWSRTDAGWSTETIPTALLTRGSLVVNDGSVVACGTEPGAQTNTSRSRCHQRSPLGAWSVLTTTTAGLSSVQVDSAGRLHALSFDSETHWVTFTGAAWQPRLSGFVLPTSTGPQTTAMRIGADGYMHLAYGEQDHVVHLRCPLAP